MKEKQNIHMACIASTLIGFAALIVCQRWTVLAQDFGTSVAVVNGVPITYDRIRMTPEAIERSFVSTYGRKPDPRDESELERIKSTFEVKTLQKEIRTLIRSHEIERFKVQVKEAEVDLRWRELVKGKDVDAQLEENRRTLSELIKALEEVCVNGEDPDVVYRNRLEGRMEKMQWDGHIKYDCTPHRRRVLETYAHSEKMTPHDYRVAIRDLIVEEKLSAVVDNELINSDPEFAEYVRLVAKNPSDPIVREKSPMYREAKRYEWWLARYREADVVIKDDRFKDAWPPDSSKREQATK